MVLRDDVDPRIAVRIVGSGPIALAFAGFLLREGFDASRITFDDRAARSLPVNPETEGRKPADGGPRRHLALSEGSCQLLRRICRLPEGGSIDAIDITLAGCTGATTIRPRDFALDRLGLVVSWTDLLASLQQALPPHPGALHRAPAVASQSPHDDPAHTIVVHAEGAPADEDVDTLDFAQGALLTEVRAPALDAAALSTAFERFDCDGPLALLPIGTMRDRYSVVWCDQIATCERRAAQAATDRSGLADELQARFGPRLGRLVIDAPIEVVRLRRKRRRVRARGTSVWIGNASQTLHPVAGQGLNLGLRDAFELARMLGDANDDWNDGANDGANDRANVDPALSRRAAGIESMLRDFAQARGRDRTTIVALTDGLARAFRSPLLHGIESALLDLLELAPALRRPLARTLLFGERG